MRYDTLDNIIDGLENDIQIIKNIIGEMEQKLNMLNLKLTNKAIVESIEQDVINQRFNVLS